MSKERELLRDVLAEGVQHNTSKYAVVEMSHALRDEIRALLSSPPEAEGEAMTLLRDFYAAYPHGRLGERARALLGAPYPTVPCRSPRE